MTDSVVVADRLTKRFGDFTAVDSVSFRLEAGEVLGYLGPNGSGKTTTLRMLLGLLQPTSGTAHLFGRQVGAGTETVRQKVGYMSQRSALYQELTVEENLAFYALAYGLADPRRRAEVLDEVGLTDFRTVRAGDLPTGWRQRLALAAALVHRPPLLILDEPTSGIDPVNRREFWDRLYQLASQGVTAIVTTHYLEEAEYCQRVGIMIRGRLLALDEPERLKETRVPGNIFDVWGDPMLEALAVLEGDPAVVLAGLAGDHLRAVVRPGVEGEALGRKLEAAGIRQARLTPGVASLEDVFLALEAGSR